MRNSLRSTVSIQLVSDLHLETPYSRPTYEEYELPVKSPHLALLGDIGYATDERLFAWFERQLIRFETVIYLLGNHEPYGSSFDEALERVLRFESENGMKRALRPEIGKFVFLDRGRYDIPGTQVTVLGCTLFSYVPQHQYETVALAVNDFSSDLHEGNIRDWTVDTHNAAHSLDLNWLNAAVTEIETTYPDREVAIFTHHSPTLLPAANRSDYLKDRRQILSAFTTDLSRQKCWLSPQVRLWSFGHTHFNCDFIEDQTGKSTRIVTNQKGYAQNEAPGFDPGLTVRLGSGTGFVSITTDREGSRYSYPGSLPKQSSSKSGSKRSSQVQSPTSDRLRLPSGQSNHRSRPSNASTRHSSARLSSAIAEESRQEASSGPEQPNMDRTAYNKALREQKMKSQTSKSGCCSGRCLIM